MSLIKKRIQQITSSILIKLFPELRKLKDDKIGLHLITDSFNESHQDKNTKLYTPYRIFNSNIGDYSYIAQNSLIRNTTIGKFCSIGPNLFCGWGIHPTNGISTHPMFYSTLKQNGMTLSKTDKVIETKSIIIGNDVFIGANVTVLDGVVIGDGAIIGAGSVVSRNIPDYAIAVGSPIQIIKYRFNEQQIQKLQKLQWWNFNTEELISVETNFFNIDYFLSTH